MKGFFKLACMLFVALSTFSAGAQTASSGKWYSGTGTATGKNMEQIRAEALNKARADAMKKAGVEVSAGTLSLKSEGNSRLIDFFSEFSESSSLGLILDEKDVRFDRPQPLDSTYIVYRVTAHIEALVAPPRGVPDPAFEVTLTSRRSTYNEYEPVTLNIRSTKSGYLTILDIHGDSLTVLFPNEIDRKNYIAANSDFVFPPSKAYSLELETERGQSSSSDVLIAVVTKDDVPFPNIDTLRLEGSKLLVAEKSLTAFANWLYRIPLDRRRADRKAIQIEKATD